MTITKEMKMTRMPNLKVDEIIQTLDRFVGSTRISQRKDCSQMDCEGSAFVDVEGIPYCDHHARDLILQIDPNVF
jgi:hypothetical protein